MNDNNTRFDYQAEADKTCSIEWGPHNVNLGNFLKTLAAFAETASTLNLYKKLLFRGKTPEQLGMSQPTPKNSLEGFIDAEDIDLVHGLLGIATEAGECVEILRDTVLKVRKPDKLNAVEECGDLRWYINRVLRWADVTDEDCERANIAKLHGRGFQFGFNKDADSNRDLDNERSILGEHLTNVHPSLPLGPHGDETC